ncbi:hypothetical protein F5Y07DRAFT_319370 [Xylaria sp. FL0933]|nr:hypothetical protein F5Y07DRAFT_319370 [Xylaria sp. FL0933]
MCCLLQFDIQATDAGGDRKSTREIWDGSSASHYDNERGFCPPGAGAGTNHETSRDILNSFTTTLQSRAESMERCNFVTLPAPRPIHILPQNRTRPNTHLNSICPSTTTTISTGNRDSWISYENPSSIHVTRDIRVHNSLPSDPCDGDTVRHTGEAGFLREEV